MPLDPEKREQMRELFRSGYFLEQAKVGLLGVSLDMPPYWVDEELTEALDAIEGPWERKKRTTVLRAASAIASGIPIRQVFDAEDTCGRSTWYGRHNPERIVGWQDHPDIAYAYEVAVRKANAHYDSLEQERLAIRDRILAKTEDRLAEITGVAAETLFEIMLDDTAHPDTRRKAAVDTLTHAAPETAPKSQGDDRINLVVDTAGPSMRDIRTRSRRVSGRTIDADAVPQEEPALEIVEGETGPPPPPVGGLRIPERGLYEPPPELTSGNGHGEEETESDE